MEKAPELSDVQLKGADGTFETVTIQGEDGPVRINKHEHDEEKHGRALDEKPARAGRHASGKTEDDYTVDELKAELDRRGIEHKSDDNKSDLFKKLRKGK